MKTVYQNGFAKMKSISNHPRLKKVLDVVSKLFKQNSKLKILDVGCGDGLFTREIGKTLHTNRLYGTDISKKAVNLANKNKVTTFLVDTDTSRFPCKSNSFDLIFCGSVIEIIDNPDTLLQELYRIVSPTGYVIVTFPNHCSWLSRIAVLFGYLPFYYRISTQYDLGKFLRKNSKGTSSGFIRLFTAESFNTLASFYGFTTVNTLGAPESSLPKILHPLDSVIAKKPSLSFQIICVLKKS